MSGADVIFWFDSCLIFNFVNKMEGIEKVVGDLYTQYQPILRDTAELLHNKGNNFF